MSVKKYRFTPRCRFRRFTPGWFHNSRIHKKKRRLQRRLLNSHDCAVSATQRHQPRRVLLRVGVITYSASVAWYRLLHDVHSPVFYTRHRLHSVGYTMLLTRLRLLRGVDCLTSGARARSHGTDHTTSAARCRLHGGVGYRASVTQHRSVTRRRRLQGLVHGAGYIMSVTSRRIQWCLLHGIGHTASVAPRQLYGVGCTTLTTRGVGYTLSVTRRRVPSTSGPGYTVSFTRAVDRRLVSIARRRIHHVG